jgi:hypothetical protein
VITDAACEISPIAKSTLWQVPGLRWLLDRAGAVPIVRRKDSPTKDASANDATFSRIATHLAGGGNILIFPEGTSHSEPHLAPLRTGAARMLLAAEQEDPSRPLTFQAAALEFDARDDFRSRCLVLWGPVREFREIAGDSEERVRAATALMDADLRELLVEGGTHDERRLIVRVAEMLANDAGDGTLQGWSSIGRQVELAGRTLRTVDAKVVAKVAERVDASRRARSARAAMPTSRQDEGRRVAARQLASPTRGRAAGGLGLRAVRGAVLSRAWSRGRRIPTRCRR